MNSTKATVTEVLLIKTLLKSLPLKQQNWVCIKAAGKYCHPPIKPLAPSNYLEFDKLKSVYFCYHLILLINCELNIFAHKLFIRSKTILSVLIHLTQRVFKGLDECWDCAVIWFFDMGPPCLPWKSFQR